MVEGFHSPDAGLSSILEDIELRSLDQRPFFVFSHNVSPHTPEATVRILHTTQLTHVRPCTPGATQSTFVGTMAIGRPSLHAWGDHEARDVSGIVKPSVPARLGRPVARLLSGRFNNVRPCTPGATGPRLRPI